MTHNNHFMKVYDSGYRHIVPIMPYDAEISPLSNVKDGNRGKIPGKRKHDGTWVGYGGWQNIVTTPEHLKLWHGWGAGVGVICGDIIAFDVDVLEEKLTHKLIDHILKTLGPAPIRIGNAPKALLPYRCAEPMKKKRISLSLAGYEKTQAVELLGKGQQFVAHGIHQKTGKPYLWDSSSEIPPAYSSLTEVTPEQVRQIW